jgi:membrane protein DedA with SNARE-associated domain
MNLDRLAEIVLDPGIPPLLIYLCVFLSCILESFFPPWPTDVLVLYAGFLAGRGQLEQSLVLVVAIVGTEIGVMAVFWLARRWGPAIFLSRFGRFVHAHRLEQLEHWFGRWGVPAVAISRFFPGIRALVMPAAGLARFSAWKVLWWAGLSVVTWNTLVVGLGVLAGTHLDWARQVLVGYNAIALFVVAVAVVGAGVVLLCRARARRSMSS